jgi:coenzyme A diphosphatase NUDT7
MRDELKDLRRVLEATISRASEDGPCAARDEPYERNAVIVPLLVGQGGAQILLQLRASHLRRSPGEVGFPGGRVEPGETPWQAALREIEEELGVPAQEVELLGCLPAQERRRGELVLPFVCRLADPQRPQPRSEEVAGLFRVPVDVLRRRGFREARIIEEYSLSPDFPRHLLPGGDWSRRLTRPVYYQQHGQRLIWGLTAAILVDLLRLTDSGG